MLTDANGNTNGYTYTPAGELAALTDGNGHVTSWTYDVYGRMAGKTDGNGVLIETNGYDADGRASAHWTPAMGLTLYVHDANGNLCTNSYSSGTNIIAMYDALNRVISLKDAVGTSSFTYTNFGAFMGALASAGGLWVTDTVAYTYANRLRTGAAVGNWSETYAYDGLLRPTSITSPAGTFGYSYNGAGMEVPTLTLPGGNSVVESYDNAGQLLSTALQHGGTTLESYAYGYDVNGNRTNVTRVDGTTVGYAYDNMNQLTSALGYEPDGTTFRGNENFGYGYDAANNLAARTNNTLQQAFTSDKANEVVNVTRNNDVLTVAGSVNSTGNTFSINGQPASVYHDLTFAVTNGLPLANGKNVFTVIAVSNSVSRTNTQVQYLPASQNLQYDANGNLVNDGRFAYVYDCANELTQVTDPGIGRTVYLYDGFGRRRIRRDYGFISNTYTLTNETHYIYDGMTVMQERNSNNVVQVSYTRGTDMSGKIGSALNSAGGIGGLLARTDGSGNNAYYHDDANGNITMLIDSSGNMLAKYLYDPYGNTLGAWGTLANVNSYRYSSKEEDRMTGMYYYGFRYYQPNLQKWLNRDPIEENGGINLFDYVLNKPITSIDPYGLDFWQDPGYYNYGWPGNGPARFSPQVGQFVDGSIGVGLGVVQMTAGAALSETGWGVLLAVNGAFTWNAGLINMIGAFAPDPEMREQAEGVPANIPGYVGLVCGGKLGKDAGSFLGDAWDLAGTENPLDAIKSGKDVYDDVMDFIKDGKKN